MKKMIIVLLTLCGCAQMEKNFQDQFCNYDGGYQEGVNDGQNGKEMDLSRITNNCNDQSKEEARRGYREGYMTVTKKTVININTNVHKNLKRCRARHGEKIHESFCSGQTPSACQVHSVCIYK